MSQQTFSQLDLTEQTQKGVAEMGFANMTEVQARTIPQLLVGRDVLGAAKTGECVSGCVWCVWCGGGGVRGRREVDVLVQIGVVRSDREHCAQLL